MSNKKILWSILLVCLCSSITILQAREIEVGVKAGFNLGFDVYHLNGVGFAGEAAWRTDLHLIRQVPDLGFKIDLGYAQSIIPTKENFKIKADFFKTTFGVSYRFRLLANPKDGTAVLKTLAIYPLVNLGLNSTLSARLTDLSENKNYVLSDDYSKFSLTCFAGCGIEIYMFHVNWFVETGMSFQVLPGIKDFSSNLVSIDKSADLSWQLFIGAKYAIFDF